MDLLNALPATVDRVANSTSEEINRAIARETEERVRHFAGARPEEISRRLEELDREWDIERTLEANAAIATVIGVALGAMVDRRFFILPAVVGAFLLQHALQGWCPPVPLFRRRGVRTPKEINRERMALKALRGDFEHTAAGFSETTGDWALDAADR